MSTPTPEEMDRANLRNDLYKMRCRMDEIWCIANRNRNGDPSVEEMKQTVKKVKMERDMFAAERDRAQTFAQGLQVELGEALDDCAKLRRAVETADGRAITNAAAERHTANKLERSQEQLQSATRRIVTAEIERDKAIADRDGAIVRLDREQRRRLELEDTCAGLGNQLHDAKLNAAAECNRATTYRDRVGRLEARVATLTEFGQRTTPDLATTRETQHLVLDLQGILRQLIDGKISSPQAIDSLAKKIDKLAEILL